MLLCCVGRHGSYQYVKGTTSIVEESVKIIGDDADEIGGLMTATPMQYEVVDMAQ